MIKPAVSDINYQIYRDISSPLRGILSIPHSGEEIPDRFYHHLTDDMAALMTDVDYQVEQLVDIPKLVSEQIAVVVAKVHRAAVDLNRPAEQAILNWKNNSQGVELVTAEMAAQVQQEVLASYYHPYFKVIEQLLEEFPAGSPPPIIDLHSMPSKATSYHLKLNPNQPQDRPDFCISDYLGKSCHADYIQVAIDQLTISGFRIGHNDPYQGGHITRFFSTQKCNIIQIETNRALYMDEDKRVLHCQQVEQLRPIMTEVVGKLVCWKGSHE